MWVPSELLHLCAMFTWCYTHLRGTPTLTYCSP